MRLHVVGFFFFIRSNRRRILNEEELVAATGTFVKSERVEFSGKTFAEQVGVLCL